MSAAVFRLASSFLAGSLPLVSPKKSSSASSFSPPSTVMTSVENGHASHATTSAKPYAVDDRDVATPSPSVPITYTQLYINGAYVDSVSKNTFDVINPTTGKKVASVSEADEKDVDVAVKAARKAYTDVWSKVTGYSRGILMNKLADLMEKHQEELAALDSIDNGKPFGIALGWDLVQCIGTIRYYAGWATKIQGKTIQVEGDFEAYTRHESIGVVGAIIPWNFPLLMAVWKIGPCLSAGNTLVIKSSEKTPLSLLRFAQLTKEAGFPDGVFNVLNGFGPAAGHALAMHMDVDKIAFTGSTAVGKKILQASANSNLKKVTVELGGKSPGIVFPDADLPAAVAGIQVGLFFNAGQVCCAGSRVYVHESVYDEFVKLASKAISAQPLAHKVNKASSLQPIVDDIQHKRVMGFIELGKKEGAHLAVGGKAGDQSFFVEPTLFTDVQDSMTIAHEEIFGPVLSVLKFSTIDEVITRANLSVYGLAAAVWTQDIAKAHYVANRIKAGTVWINCHNYLTWSVPFGGYKQSGIGRDLGEYALAEYTQCKSVITAIPTESSKLKINIKA